MIAPVDLIVAWIGGFAWGAVATVLFFEQVFQKDNRI